ncbi:XamI restriction endonuclease [Branchiibius hedensis]|uniref:XamI restriction endonuclease n=2 Tax=Branchiibius TaxID=908251 RepID=A0A2Y8ZX39_9MICO|nr:XamI family restriction endonuclease [Branchiibius hedensis]PWJ25624.1 XamI restriction endonuclease [Branchiibius hedensis]SSA34437.1 XamI restriction endonuclease [Branchiibius hedensis]
MTATPPRWDNEQLTSDRLTATTQFREERTTEPLDHYLEFYEDAYSVFADVMEASDDLRKLRETAADLLLNKSRQHLCRYVASPPLSEDDLKTLGDCSLAIGALKANPDNIDILMEYILMGLDRERFPWVGEDREPSESERQAAIVSTAAMFAMRKMETFRRGRGKAFEKALKVYLAEECGLTEVKATVISNASQGPQIGEFSGESSVVGGKADIVVRLFDGRLLPIECKVSNSETNSYKRLIHDCGEKAQAWVADLGVANCLPVAALSGCYSLGNLNKAQNMGLTLIWSHDFEPLGTFIESTLAEPSA